MAVEVESTGQIEEFLRVLRKRVWWIIVPFFLVASLGTAYAVIVPKKFVSSVRVMVRENDESASSISNKAQEGKWVGRRKFSLESDPYLEDHRVAGTPYVPGVIGLEVFAQTLESLGGNEGRRQPLGLTEVSFALPVKLLRDRPIDVRAVATGAPGEDMSLTLAS